MHIEIKVPPLGESVTQAVISKILKPSGSFVAQDEEILEMETEKVNQVLYAQKAGMITLKVQEGETVTIGQTLGVIDTDAVTPPSTAVKKEAVAPLIKPQELPPARILAETFVKESQTNVPPSPAPLLPSPPATLSRKKMSGLRKVIAERLVAAKNQTAMLTTFNEVDMSHIMAIRAKEKDAFAKKYGVKLGFMSFFIKAVVFALKNIKEVGSFIDGDEIVTPETYDISVAVSTERGLLVPVIRHADRLSFDGLEKELERLAKKAREGSLSIDALRGGCFTITNGGVFGSLLSTPILNPPQSAILGMHSIVERPIALNQQVVIRPMMYIALSYDHRIIDGKEAVLFLVTLKQQLEDPSRLFLEL